MCIEATFTGLWYIQQTILKASQDCVDTSSFGNEGRGFAAMAGGSLSLGGIHDRSRRGAFGLGRLHSVVFEPYQ